MKILIEHKCPVCGVICLDRDNINTSNVVNIPSLIKPLYCNNCVMARIIDRRNDIMHIMVSMGDKDEYRSL